MSTNEITRDDLEGVKVVILDYVVTAYGGPKIPGRAEPKITEAGLVGYLEQHRISSLNPHEGDKLRKRWTREIVRRAVKSLRINGDLQSSIGIGESGREARMFEPGLRQRPHQPPEPKIVTAWEQRVREMSDEKQKEEALRFGAEIKMAKATLRDLEHRANVLCEEMCLRELIADTANGRAIGAQKALEASRSRAADRG